MKSSKFMENFHYRRASHSHVNHCKKVDSFLKRVYSTEKTKPSPLNKPLVLKRPIYPLFEIVNLKNFPFK